MVDLETGQQSTGTPVSQAAEADNLEQRRASLIERSKPDQLAQMEGALDVGIWLKKCWRFCTTFVCSLPVRRAVSAVTCRDSAQRASSTSSSTAFS